MNPWKQIQDKARNGRITTDKRVWDTIEYQLNTQEQTTYKKALYRSVWIAAAIAIFVSAGIYFILESDPVFQVEPLISEHLPDHDASDQLLYLYSDLDLEFHEKGKLVPNFKKLSQHPLIIQKNL